MLNEKKLSKAELAKREDIIMKMKKNKSSLVKKYGKDAEKVMYGRATNIAKKQAESMENTKIREMIKSALMGPGADIEAGEDRYQGEKDLSQASAMLDNLESKLKSHDWWYMMSDDHRAYKNGSYEQDEIRSIMKDLEGLGYGKDAKDLFNQYAPHQEGGPSFRISEKKGKDMDGDGDVDSEDYLAAKDAAIKKAKSKKVNEMWSFLRDPFAENLKEDWGSSDQSAMNQSIHRDLGNPTEFPGLSQIMDAAEDAVDFYWDDWDEYQTDRKGLIIHAAQIYANKMFPEFMAGMRRMMEPIDEMDINDPVLMKMRAAKTKTAKAGGDGNDKFFEKNAARLSKLKALKDKRAEIMRDMEQEAEPEGGPIADRYGRELNKIDAAIAKLEGKKEMDYDTAVGKKSAMADPYADHISMQNAMFGLEEGTELYNNNGFYFKRFYGGKENGPSLQITTDAGDFITIPGGKLGLFMSGLEKAVSVFDDMSRQLPIDEDLDLGHEDNEPHMLKADLYRIGKYAMELYQMVDKFEESSEEVDFPHWWQSKVIKAKDALVGAKHYLDFELKEPQIDAMVDVAQDVEAIDEGTWSVGSSKDIKSVMDALDQMMGLKNPKDIVRYLSKLDKFLYNTVGDDIFHDDIDGAKREASEGNMDRAQNRLSDAYSRAEYFLERQMDREGFKESKLNEEDPGKADMIAAAIQKALNKHKGDESKTYQLQQARKAMNKGDLGKAEKIAKRYSVAEILAKQLKEEGGVIDEGFLDRFVSNLKGVTAKGTTSFDNFKAYLKGDKESIKDPKLAQNMAMLKQKSTTLDKELNDVINDLNKMFPKDVLEKTPESFQNVLAKYAELLDKTKIVNTKIASGDLKSPTSSNDKTSTNAEPAKDTPSKTGQARDEKGRFVSSKKKASTKVKPIDSNYEVTDETYQYKGKDYQVQLDKKTKDKFFQHEDGRVMDIAQIEKNSKVKKKK